MNKLKCIVSYDGTNFSGYQVQPNKRTIQSEIEKAIEKIHKGKHIRIYSSGRTDAGVHAKGQVFHFESPLDISPERWKMALNSLLPEDIYVKETAVAPGTFHARFSAIEKEYRYFVLIDNEIDVFKRNYRYIINEKLDMNLIEKACNAFVGTHDFTAFCSARSTVKSDKIRTLSEVTCVKSGNELQFTLKGNGFLYHMVRIIVSVLIDAGQGLVSPTEIENIFTTGKRGNIGKTLPPNGLYLWEVTY